MTACIYPCNPESCFPYICSVLYSAAVYRQTESCHRPASLPLLVLSDDDYIDDPAGKHTLQQSAGWLQPCRQSVQISTEMAHNVKSLLVHSVDQMCEVTPLSTTAGVWVSTVILPHQGLGGATNVFWCIYKAHETRPVIANFVLFQLNRICKLKLMCFLGSPTQLGLP